MAFPDAPVSESPSFQPISLTTSLLLLLVEDGEIDIKQDKRHRPDYDVSHDTSPRRSFANVFDSCARYSLQQRHLPGWMAGFVPANEMTRYEAVNSFSQHANANDPLERELSLISNNGVNVVPSDDDVTMIRPG
jgi:hypothetical protein